MRWRSWGRGVSEEGMPDAWHYIPEGMSETLVKHIKELGTDDFSLILVPFAPQRWFQPLPPLVSVIRISSAWVPA